ncbi:MAG TPA: TIGR01777 family oxidoreductase [Actinomycetales bacterium]|nr:TIGR01777 family oxidoreductase [Actinomycetales bacterium]
MPHVVVAGASGFLGSALRGRLGAEGVEVRQLVRHAPSGPGEVRWDPAQRLDPEVLRGALAVVNLGGASLAHWPWTASYRRAIISSRTTGTATIARAVAELATDGDAPRLLQGSAVGFYGSRGDEVLDEHSAAGDTFLAHVCRAWEDSARVAEDAGAAVVRLRTGLVLAPSGGAVAPLYRLLRLGLGGWFGDGRQWWPWISLRDHVASVVHLLRSDLTGPVNLTAPEPARNKDLVRALGGALHRPTLLPAPAPALRLVLGQAADDLLLASQRVLPVALQDDGFGWTDAGPGDVARYVAGSG